MREAMYYTHSKAVSTVIIGCNNIAQLEDNVRVACEFTPLNDKQSTDLVARVERCSKPSSESALYFQIQPIVLILDRRKRSQRERSRSQLCLPVCTTRVAASSCCFVSDAGTSPTLDSASGPCTGASRSGCCGSTASSTVGMSNSISTRSPFFHVRRSEANFPGFGLEATRLLFTEIAVFAPAHAGMRSIISISAGFSAATSILVDASCGYFVCCISPTRCDPRCQVIFDGT